MEMDEWEMEIMDFPDMQQKVLKILKDIQDITFFVHYNSSNHCDGYQWYLLNISLKNSKDNCNPISDFQNTYSK